MPKVPSALGGYLWSVSADGARGVGDAFRTGGTYALIWEREKGARPVAEFAAEKKIATPAGWT